MQRVALCLITGDGTSHEDWDRLLASAAPWVDGIYVGYTGDSPEFPFSTTESMTVEHVGWDQDFAKARNANMAMVPRSEYDWVMWLDSDDELLHGEQLNDLLAAQNERVGVVFMKYWYAVNPDTGEVVVEQFRERIFRSSVETQWNFMIHEVVHFAPGTAMSKPETDVIVKHWRNLFAGDNIGARKRNREMLTEAQKRDPDEPRYHIYLAHEVFAEYQAHREDGKESSKAVLQSARRLYETYLQRYGQIEGEDPYMANCRLADCLRESNRWNEAVDRDLQGIKMRPNYPEAYVGIAMSFLNTQQFELAIQWAKRALTCGERENYLAAQEVQGNTYTPWFIVGAAHEALEEWSEAEEAYTTCMGISHHVNDYTAKISEMQANAEATKAANVMRKATFGTHSDRSICFVSKPLFEPWHPEIIKAKGSGGTESCIVETANRFAADGWRVAVFGSPGAYRGTTVDGVEYWDTNKDFDVSEQWTVAVALRSPEFFDADISAETKVLWMHDVTVGDVQVGPWGDRFDRFDLMLGVSKWHAEHLRKVYNIAPERVGYVNNAIYPERFNVVAERDPFKFVYASSPDRGLDNLLEIWPAIKQNYPEASLDVFYGWSAIDKIIARHPGHPLLWLKEKINELMEAVNEDGSIVWHDRVSRDALAEHYAKASIWAYPTAFCETFCITALETQAAGVIPVASQLAALQETVAMPGLLIPGHAANQSYRAQWLDMARSVIEHDGVRDELRAAGIEHASKFTWDASYDQWRVALGQIASHRLPSLS